MGWTMYVLNIYRVAALLISQTVTFFLYGFGGFHCSFALVSSQIAL